MKDLFRDISHQHSSPFDLQRRSEARTQAPFSQRHLGYESANAIPLRDNAISILHLS